MREVIEKVMSAEADAQRCVSVARTEGVQIVERARRQAREMVEQAGQEAKAEAQEILAAAENAARREKQERLARAAAEIKAAIQLDETTKQCAVVAALRCLYGGAA